MTQRAFYDRYSTDIDRFRAEIDRRLDPAFVPSATEVQKNIPIYDGAEIRARLGTGAARAALLAEWSHVLANLSGVLVIRGVYQDLETVDAATAVFNDIIAAERAGSQGGGDHFAAAGHNDRIWNALQKLALAAPDVFARYHARPEIDAVAEAWLGPGYQMSAQVNLVRPGGAAQTAHRDYHLGFMSAQQAARYPARAHDMTASLTLQGGIAHVNAPLEAGPTKLLPFSQTYGAGYLAYHEVEFAELFEERCVQLPLSKGDTLFFNPALFHAAGENRSQDVARMVNLVQISSAFGRAMEAIDREAMSIAVYPALQRLQDNGMSADQINAAIAATAEGYAFPSNLDTDPPVGGLAPETQAGLMRRALETGMAPSAFADAINAQVQRRLP